jgi:hypothetical protein
MRDATLVVVILLLFQLFPNNRNHFIHLDMFLLAAYFSVFFFFGGGGRKSVEKI